MQSYFLKRAKTLTYACLLLLISVTVISGQSMFRKILDFDGDQRADFVVVRYENNILTWYVWQSTDGFRAVHWGLATDSAAPGDYDGDGKTDFAVYRRQNSSSNSVRHDFYILQSSNNSFVAKSFTTNQGFIYYVNQQDYDGDGKTDPAVWVYYEVNSSTFILQSSTSLLRSVPLFGGQHYAVKIGDMDGDSSAESASTTLSGASLVTWLNLTNNNMRTTQFGSAFSDDHLPADFDGDDIGDLTVFRRSEGNWYWLRSSDNVFQAIHWGLEGDLPVPADYDGDGRTDQAVYRRGSPNGIYYINGSQSGFRAFVWGNPSTDIAVTYQSR